MIKAKFGDYLRSKTNVAMVNEATPPPAPERRKSAILPTADSRLWEPKLELIGERDAGPESNSIE